MMVIPKLLHFFRRRVDLADTHSPHQWSKITKLTITGTRNSLSELWNTFVGDKQKQAEAAEEISLSIDSYILPCTATRL